MKRFAVIAASLLLSQAAIAGPEQQLLKVAEASRNATYEGVVIYRSGSDMESLRLVHGMVNGTERERISALTGERREVIRDGERVICLMPNDRKADFKRPPLKGLLSGMTPQTLSKLSNWYTVKEIGSGRVAGRSCRGVEFAPRDGYRYRYEIWSDEQTNVPLRVALTTLNHQVLEEVMFTEVSFPESLPVTAFNPESDPQHYRAIDLGPSVPTRSASWDGFPVHLISPLPGYQITARDRRAARNGKGVVEHLMISDGLSAISIFAATGVSNERGFSGLTRRGGVHAYGRVVGDYHVTVVGETPAEAVKQVAESLAPAEAAP